MLLAFQGLAYALSLGSFRGGPTFPAVFLGAAGGLLASHLPGFPVDVVRRWPSVEKAERLLGWRARIGVEEGIRQTAEWLRVREGSSAAASLVGSRDRRSNR